MADGTTVFTPLADDYAGYRPGYPREVLDELVRVCGLVPAWRVADVGSGTGNLARLFLSHGNPVLGIEPNAAMRAQAERLLAGCSGFRSLDGTAEALPLDDASVDLVSVGQALHWFAAERARAEFQRVLRGAGWVAVAWNQRQVEATAFTREYHAVTQAQAVSEPVPAVDAGLDTLFAGVPEHTATFALTQRFDRAGLLGRARSSRFLPQPGHPAYDACAAALTELFARHQEDGAVTFHYLTKLFVGRLEPTSRPA